MKHDEYLLLDAMVEILVPLDIDVSIKFIGDVQIMKKLVMMIMVFMLFALVACDETDGEMSFDNYSFGDTINLWDSFEIVLHNEIRFVDDFPLSPYDVLSRPDERETDWLVDLHWIAYESGVVLFPATFTSITDNDCSVGIRHNLEITGPNGLVSSYAMASWRIIATYMGSLQGVGELPRFTTPIQAREMREGYLPAIYDGDGEYTIRFIPIRDGISMREEAKTIVVQVTR